MTASRLHETLSRLSTRTASSVVARGRIASPALNTALLRRLSVRPGEEDAFLADPGFEVARTWEPADLSLDDLAGGLLHPDMITALDEAEVGRMPRDMHPWSHQLAAWKAARGGLSCLVSSGTGSGKTECFMVPILDDLLRDQAKGLLTGVRAIVIYPLNALIESQRKRLAAWTAPLKHRFRFALYNGLTPEAPRQQDNERLAVAEIGNRRMIRETPPAILVTNVTMLEYLLLRAQDRPILECSQGLLRWIVLDEAHGYIGAQAAEMALLLRRVRMAFGVKPDQVRLMATSATISEGDGTEAKLKRFASDLAGVDEDRVQVIQGRTVDPELPKPGVDKPIEPEKLVSMPAAALWECLAHHPRVQKLKHEMSKQSASLSEAERILFGIEGGDRREETQAVLDAAAQAQCPETGALLLPWRVHIFHRAQGGFWVCVDPSCGYRDRELAAEGSDWGFGAIWLKQRDRCDCAAPVFELFACDECGTPHLVAGLEVGTMARLVPLRAIEMDDFAVDAEPDTESNSRDFAVHGRAVLSPARGDATDRFLGLDDGTVFDNAPPEDARWIRIALEDDEAERACCPGAESARLAPQRYGPPFFMGTAMPTLIEALASPFNEPGRPMSGRRALTFSDSRQGTARLAAKLQQDSERNLTRAFLYHAVQEDRGPEGEEREKLERRLERFKSISDPELAEDVAENIQGIEQKLSGEANPIPWSDLVDRFTQHNELRDSATEVWRERTGGGREMADDPAKLATMFLYRELFRRPKVQNNAETMGLVRLSFPKLEEKASTRLPRVLSEVGANKTDWIGLALAAVDFVFRERLATWIAPDWMMRFVSPRWRTQRYSICSAGSASSDRPANSRPWPNPTPQAGRPSRFHRLVYAMIQGDFESKVDQDRADEVFSELWSMITSTAAKDIGGGAYQLDFANAAVVRLDNGWLCPVTRRIFGYSPDSRSPYDPDCLLKPINLPRLPKANPGGLHPGARVEAANWCQSDTRVCMLRRKGLWTDLHDRVAAYAPFLRAQEHSAQIERPVLADYERRFKEGWINLLNCSTTMEMGVDIPDVQLVVNSNAPPSISNYRQRLGRAGRRGEPWAFGMTFCRDLPLDRIVFDDPGRFLTARITAPAVRLDGPDLVARHVHAALLGAFLRKRPEGFDLRASTGAFFGATDDASGPVAEESVADDFLGALRGKLSQDDRLASDLAYLTRGTALAEMGAPYLAAMTAEAFERMLRRWRREYVELLVRRDAAFDQEVKRAFAMRAYRMKGEFLLGELARRGFTPSYGFPVDVVAFDHLSGHNRGRDSETISFGERRGGASRTLDIAIREYAPGAEIVVDGLVHRSEGVLPAWGAMADASKLEDLQFFWECPSCRVFGLVRMLPETCPACSAPSPRWKRSLRPAGFLGRRAPHTGYENLGHVPYEMPRLSASGGTWRALPDPEAGRWRADPQGQAITLGSGPYREGYALCLDCGRAEAETEDAAGGASLPDSIRRHRPLASARGARLKGGYCPGGHTRPERVQRNVRLIHAVRTDVFELQLPAGKDPPKGLALAAGLREALTERLGAEAREIGVSVDSSKGPANENRVSTFLYDRASGGAGLSSRLAETEWFDHCLKQACHRLCCPEDCVHGCPACVLRPDLNFGEELDRPGGLELAQTLRQRLQLPKVMQVFGSETRFLGTSLAEWLDRRGRTGGLASVTFYLHGAPAEWELADWLVDGLFGRLNEVGARLEIVMENRVLTDKGMNLAQKLDLHRLAARSSLAVTSVLPTVGGTPVLAVIEDVQGLTAIATSSADEASPGSKWGLGEQAPLVHGPASELPITENFASEQLVTLSSGNARIIRAGARLDGWIADFGDAFWTLLETEAPLAIAALWDHGVREATYVDRYLLTPLALRLLVEVVSKVPGRRAASLNVSTARLSRTELQGWAIFHTFPEDAMRRAVLKELLPDARIDIRNKSELPHERSLRLFLGDGRTTTILLDQGFGAWRAHGTPRYDFSDGSAKQARSLKSLNFGVGVEAGREAPIVLEEEKAFDL